MHFSAGGFNKAPVAPSWRRLAPSAVLLAAACVLAQVPARADEPERVIVRNPDVFPAPWTRSQVAAIGAATTAGSYGLAVGASYLFPGARGADQLRIPVAGPWLALGETGCPADDPHCPIVPIVIRAVLTGLDGVMQAGGLFVMLEGAFMPTRRVAPEPSALLPSPRRSSHRAVWLRPAPLVAGRDGMGLALLGRF